MNWKSKSNHNLIEAFLSLKTREEAECFLRDLMTENEIGEFAKRLQAAQMLERGTPYAQIESTTGLSSTTVARVSKWLKGTGGGYRGVVGKMHHHSSSLARED